MERMAYLESRAVLADSGSHNTDINVVDPISAIIVEVRVGNSTTHNQANTIAQNISAIEVIAGSEVLFSLDGPQALALTAYHFGQIPYQLITENPSTTQNLAIIIPFGRFIGDTEFALVPGRYQNPQVRITWNLATVTAVGVTGFVTGSARLTIMPILLVDGVTPTKMLTTKEIYSWTTAASGDEYINLPTDYPYRNIIIRGAKSNTALYSLLSQVKINVDSDRFVPMDMRMTDTIRYFAQRAGPFHYKHQVFGTTADVFYPVLKVDESVQLTPDSGENVCAYQNSGDGAGALAIASNGSAVSTDITMIADVQGWCPYHCVQIPFGQPMNPATWMPAPQYRSLRAEITQGSASGTGAIVAQQAR